MNDTKQKKLLSDYMAEFGIPPKPRIDSGACRQMWDSPNRTLHDYGFRKVPGDGPIPFPELRRATYKNDLQHAPKKARVREFASRGIKRNGPGEPSILFKGWSFRGIRPDPVWGPPDRPGLCGISDKEWAQFEKDLANAPKANDFTRKGHNTMLQQPFPVDQEVASDIQSYEFPMVHPPQSGLDQVPDILGSARYWENELCAVDPAFCSDGEPL